MKRLAKVLRVLAVPRLVSMLVAIGLSSDVIAAICRANPSIAYFNEESGSYSVGRDLEIYSTLGPVKTYTGFVGLSCNSMVGAQEYTFYRQASLPAVVGFTSINGLDYAVYSTTIPSIGLAVASKFTDGTWVKGFTENISEQVVPGVGQRANVRKNFEVRYALVAIAALKSGTYALGEIDLGTYGVRGPDGSTINGSGTIPDSLTGLLYITALACSVTDVSVDMGDQRATDFDNPSSLRDVRIRLHNCPPGMRSVKYYIDGQWLDRNAAVLRLDDAGAGGAARGVGVQLLHEDGVTPLAATWFPGQKADGYDGNTGADFEIRLKARYRRLGAVSGGPANASATITMIYQ
jgi:type 1 fimbria pilin